MSGKIDCEKALDTAEKLRTLLRQPVSRAAS